MFATFRGGISMTTYMKKATDSTESTGCSPPVNGKKYGPVIHPWNESVPVFDCRGTFQLMKYHKCPPDNEDPEIGSFITVIFTLGRFKEGDIFVVSPNIQVVLRLGDQKDHTVEEGTVPKYIWVMKPFGVTGPDIVYAESEEVAAEGESDKDDETPFV
ncbi:uncharacterized protein ARMOST_15216 [Armillaria ostoyae]|uniref:Uncharacterized protein n=1 Tax=Armillaria ostoyae TaxID=47428 RepID=A0A284RSS5_ARMOS|nr:uncharacterized protein ARMOST_15216 [Armillaria ostoyae]